MKKGDLEGCDEIAGLKGTVLLWVSVINSNFCVNRVSVDARMWCGVMGGKC